MKLGLPFYVLLLSLGLGTADMVGNYAALPDTVATHFDMSGQPNDWMSKTGFLAVSLSVLALLAGTFMGLPALIGKFPDSMINVPHKEYWLAPQRRSQTLNWFARQLHWFGSMTVLFMIWVFHQVIRFNLGNSMAHGKSFWFPLIAFFLFTIFWSLRLYLKFRNAPTHARF